MFIFSKCLYSLTWNVSRPYSDDKREILLPSFSRVRQDLIFKKGDEIEIFFFPQKRPMKVEWELTYNMVNKSFLKGTGETCLDRSVRVVVPSEKLLPGFFDLKVKVYVTEQEHVEGLSTFGYRVEDMEFTENMPKDFESFWEEAKDKVKNESLNIIEEFECEMDDAQISKYNLEEASRPEDYDPEGKKYNKIRAYKISFTAGGQRFYGRLSVPIGEGPFPGLLVVPGAGIGKVPIPAEQARHGFVTLMLQIHPNLELNHKSGIKIPEYLKYIVRDYPNEIKDEYLYNVFLGCIGAVNYLKQRKDVDPKKIAVAGQSQGGMLSLITAALSKDVTAVVSTLTAFGYWPFREYVKRVNRTETSGWPKIVKPPFSVYDKRIKYLSYYDTMNFAKYVKCPVMILACLCDRVTPVTTAYCVHKNIAGSSKIYFSPNTNHDFIISFEKLAWRWLQEMFD